VLKWYLVVVHILIYCPVVCVRVYINLSYILIQNVWLDLEKKSKKFQIRLPRSATAEASGKCVARTARYLALWPPATTPGERAPPHAPMAPTHHRDEIPSDRRRDSRTIFRREGLVSNEPKVPSLFPWTTQANHQSPALTVSVPTNNGCRQNSGACERPRHRHKDATVQ
jgi:hypothetical protein